VRAFSLSTAQTVLAGETHNTHRRPAMQGAVVISFARLPAQAQAPADPAAVDEPAENTCPVRDIG
jgi:hypothetical protein